MGGNLFSRVFGNIKKRFYEEMNVKLAGNEDYNVYEIENLPANISDADFLKLCYEPNMPKVFRGAAKDWPAIKKWGLDFFEKEHGHKVVELLAIQGLAPGQQYETMTLADYIKEVRKGTRKYLKFSDIVNFDDNLKADFDLKWLRKMTALPLSWGEDLKTFMGVGGTLTPLHIGFSPVLFIQVTGQKKWHFYPSTDRMFLNARTERASYMFSDADPYKKDDPNFPLLKYAKHYEIILNPGDVLWFPSFTWHQVENITPSIGIRYGRGSFGCAWKSSKLLTILFFLVTKPSLPEHLYNSYIKKKLVVKDIKPNTA
jgi:lysine-specific demethylase 8